MRHTSNIGISWVCRHFQVSFQARGERLLASEDTKPDLEHFHYPCHLFPIG